MAGKASLLPLNSNYCTMTPTANKIGSCPDLEKCKSTGDGQEYSATSPAESREKLQAAAAATRTVSKHCKISSMFAKVARVLYQIAHLCLLLSLALIFANLLPSQLKVVPWLCLSFVLLLVFGLAPVVYEHDQQLA